MLEFIGAMVLLGFMVFLAVILIKGVPNKIREKDAQYQKERLKKEQKETEDIVSAEN